MTQTTVRYFVTDVDEATDFYCIASAFVDLPLAPFFAVWRKRLTTAAPRARRRWRGQSRWRPKPGGWNRFQISRCRSRRDRRAPRAVRGRASVVRSPRDLAAARSSSRIRRASQSNSSSPGAPRRGCARGHRRDCLGRPEGGPVGRGRPSGPRDTTRFAGRRSLAFMMCAPVADGAIPVAPEDVVEAIGFARRFDIEVTVSGRSVASALVDFSGDGAGPHADAFESRGGPALVIIHVPAQGNLSPHWPGTRHDPRVAAARFGIGGQVLGGGLGGLGVGRAGLTSTRWRGGGGAGRRAGGGVRRARHHEIFSGALWPRGRPVSVVAASHSARSEPAASSFHLKWTSSARRR